MHTRRLPGTDLDLSVVGFGCWALGDHHWGTVDAADAQGAIDAALEAGVTWFDTAPVYGWGRSDEVMRDALGSRIHDVIVATKVGVKRHGKHAHSELTAEHVTADLEASLTRLGVDTIDLLQVHWPCELGTPLEETFGTLARLQEQGKFRYLGVCNYGAATMAPIQAITPIVSNQVGYNLLRRDPEGGLLAEAQRLGIGVLAYEPLARGLLTGKYTHPPTFPEHDLRARDDRFSGRGFFHAQRLAADLGKVARKVGVPTAALAAGWVASQPGVTSVIVGAKRAEQVHQNVLADKIAGHAKVEAVVRRIADVHGPTPPPF